MTPCPALTQVSLIRNAAEAALARGDREIHAVFPEWPRGGRKEANSHGSTGLLVAQRGAEQRQRWRPGGGGGPRESLEDSEETQLGPHPRQPPCDWSGHPGSAGTVTPHRSSTSARPGARGSELGGRSLHPSRGLYILGRKMDFHFFPPSLLPLGTCLPRSW